MTTRDLEVFAAVAEHGSMSAAARALRVSQSSVSQAVADIEREYGVLLFDRCAHSLHLTPTGETLLAYAQKTLFLVREIDGFLRSGTCRSELRVGASVTVGSCVLSPILRRLQAQLPGLQPRVVVSNTHEIVDLLLKSRLDVGLVEGRVDHPGLAVRPAMEDRLVIVCPPGHPFFRPSLGPAGGALRPGHGPPGGGLRHPGPPGGGPPGLRRRLPPRLGVQQHRGHPGRRTPRLRHQRPLPPAGPGRPGRRAAVGLPGGGSGPAPVLLPGPAQEQVSLRRPYPVPAGVSGLGPGGGCRRTISIH